MTRWKKRKKEGEIGVSVVITGLLQGREMYPDLQFLSPWGGKGRREKRREDEGWFSLFAIALFLLLRIGTPHSLPLDGGEGKSGWNLPIISPKFAK